MYLKEASQLIYQGFHKLQVLTTVTLMLELVGYGNIKGRQAL